MTTLITKINCFLMRGPVKMATIKVRQTKLSKKRLQILPQRLESLPKLPPLELPPPLVPKRTLPLIKRGSKELKKSKSTSELVQSSQPELFDNTGYESEPEAPHKGSPEPKTENELQIEDIEITEEKFDDPDPEEKLEKVTTQDSGFGNGSASETTSNNKEESPEPLTENELKIEDIELKKEFDDLDPEEQFEKVTTPDSGFQNGSASETTSNDKEEVIGNEVQTVQAYLGIEPENKCESAKSKGRFHDEFELLMIMILRTFQIHLCAHHYFLRVLYQLLNH